MSWLQGTCQLSVQRSGQQKSIKSSSKNRVGAASAKVGEKKNGKQNSKKVKDQLRLEKKDGKKNKVRFQETVTDQDPHELDAEKVRSEISSYSTRNQLDIDIPRQNLEFSKGRFLHSGAKTWNEIPRNTSMSPTINTFKRNLKGFLQS